MVLIPALEVFGYSFRSDGKLGYYYMAMVLLIVSTVYLHYLIRSNFGRSIIALRDNEDYAVARGVALARQRLLTFAASAVFTGACGGLYAQYLRTASPDMFGFAFVTLALSMLLLGGISTMWDRSSAPSSSPSSPSSWSISASGAGLIIGTLIVLVLRYYPAGLLSLLDRVGGAWFRPQRESAPPAAVPERSGSDLSARWAGPRDWRQRHTVTPMTESHRTTPSGKRRARALGIPARRASRARPTPSPMSAG